MVNLRPETDPETEYVSFDRPRVLRVLARIIADLDGLAGFPPIAEEEAKGGRRGPTRPPPATVGGARPAAETTDGAGRAGRPPRFAESSAVREGLNEPGPGPLIRTIRPTPPDCVVCYGKRTNFDA